MMYSVTGTDPINVDALNATGISNFRDIVSNINRSITLIRDNGDGQIAKALEELGQLVVIAPCLEHSRQAIIEALRTLAWEASLLPAQRQLGIVRAALDYIPLLLGVHSDVLFLCQSQLENLRGFFNKENLLPSRQQRPF